MSSSTLRLPRVDGTGATSGLTTTKATNLDARRVRAILRSVQERLATPRMAVETVDATGGLVLDSDHYPDGQGVREIDPRLASGRFAVAQQMFTIEWDILRNPSGYQTPILLPNFLPSPPQVNPVIILPYFVLDNPGLGYNTNNVKQVLIGGVPVGQEQAGFETFTAPEDGVYYIQFQATMFSEGGAATFFFGVDGFLLDDTVKVLQEIDNTGPPPLQNLMTDPYATGITTYRFLRKGQTVQTFGQFKQQGNVDIAGNVGVSTIFLRIILLASL